MIEQHLPLVRPGITSPYKWWPTFPSNRKPFRPQLLQRFRQHRREWKDQRIELDPRYLLIYIERGNNVYRKEYGRRERETLSQQMKQQIRRRERLFLNKLVGERERECGSLSLSLLETYWTIVYIAVTNRGMCS